MGPIQPTDNRPPVFSQIYVLDPQFADKETDIRFANMLLPATVNETEKERLRRLLNVLQLELRSCNRYVQDLKFACEIIEQHGPESVQLIIDGSKRPEGEHERRFNRPGMHEISGE